MLEAVEGSCVTVYTEYKTPVAAAACCSIPLKCISYDWNLAGGTAEHGGTIPSNRRRFFARNMKIRSSPSSAGVSHVLVERQLVKSQFKGQHRQLMRDETLGADQEMSHL